MKSIGFGIIGCGVIGTRHMSDASQSPMIKLVAVADLVEERARRSAELFGVKSAYFNGDDLLDDPEVEAVVLAFPTKWRTKLGLRAFSKGKHVLTEKPVAMNADEVRQLISARGDLVAGCCSSRFRFTESAKKATDFIASGGLGDLREAYCRAFVAAGEKPEVMPPEWRLKRGLNGGGILVNWGCYDIDYLLGLTGWSLKPRRVFAQMWAIPPQFEPHIAPGSDAETHYTALIRCDGGTVIMMERGEYMPAQSENTWQIIGSKGSLRLTMDRDPKPILHDDTSTEKGVITNILWQGTQNPSFDKVPVTDFAEAIRENRQPKTNLENALVVQQITDAIYASAEQGTIVEIK